MFRRYPHGYTFPKEHNFRKGGMGRGSLTGFGKVKLRESGIFTVGMPRVYPRRGRAVDDEQHVHRCPAVKSLSSCLEHVLEQQEKAPVNTISFNNQLFRNSKTFPKGGYGEG